MLAGNSSVGLPYMSFATASALFSPLARSSIFFDCIMLFKPMVYAFLGTSDISEKSLALSFTVLSARVTK